MGTLITSAVARLRCPEEANIRAPESVLSLHVGFIQAGAELIETNTFGANRRKLAARFLEDEVERINSEAVKIAREARQVSGREVLIARRPRLDIFFGHEPEEGEPAPAADGGRVVVQPDFTVVVIGMNAITIYVAVHFVPFEKIAYALVGGFGRLIGSKLEAVAPHLAQTTGPFVVSLTAMLLVWLLLYHLYRHKIFLRI